MLAVYCCCEYPRSCEGRRQTIEVIVMAWAVAYVERIRHHIIRISVTE
jgi:hypothetical protein